MRSRIGARTTAEVDEIIPRFPTTDAKVRPGDAEEREEGEARDGLDEDVHHGAQELPRRILVQISRQGLVLVHAHEERQSLALLHLSRLAALVQDRLENRPEPQRLRVSRDEPDKVAVRESVPAQEKAVQEPPRTQRQPPRASPSRAAPWNALPL